LAVQSRNLTDLGEEGLAKILSFQMSEHNIRSLLKRVFDHESQVAATYQTPSKIIVIVGIVERLDSDTFDVKGDGEEFHGVRYDQVIKLRLPRD